MPYANIELWLEAFNIRLIFTKDTVKTVQEYRSHFANWLPKIPNYRTADPRQYDPINDPEIKQTPETTSVNATADKFKKHLK